MQYKIGDLITTNSHNCFKILDINDDDYCLKNLLNSNFQILSKTEHKYLLFEPSIVLSNCLVEVLKENDLTEVQISNITNYMFTIFKNCL